MAGDRPTPADGPYEIEMRRQLPVTPQRAFAAWTDPDEMRQWWGPRGVHCVAVELDLRVGGAYRIGNELPDKSVLWIDGVFEVVDIPNRLEYTWSTSRDGASIERVSVRFEANDAGTEIVIRHSRIPTETLVDDHRHGWQGCLAGLAEHLSPDSR